MGTLATTRPQSDMEVARLFAHVCGAVAALHDLQLLHLDLKPSQVARRPDTELKLALAWLIDFESIRAADRRLAQRVGARMLLRPYATTLPLSPEESRARGSAGHDLCRVSTATDVYRLGVVLARLLRPGRDAAAAIAGMQRAVAAAVRRPPTSPLRHELTSLYADATRVAPADRPSAAEMVSRLSQFVELSAPQEALNVREQISWSAAFMACLLNVEGLRAQLVSDVAGVARYLAKVHERRGDRPPQLPVTLALLALASRQTARPAPALAAEARRLLARLLGDPEARQVAAYLLGSLRRRGPTVGAALAVTALLNAPPPRGPDDQRWSPDEAARIPGAIVRLGEEGFGWYGMLLIAEGCWKIARPWNYTIREAGISMLEGLEHLFQHPVPASLALGEYPPWDLLRVITRRALGCLERPVLTGVTILAAASMLTGDHDGVAEARALLPACTPTRQSARLERVMDDFRRGGDAVSCAASVCAGINFVRAYRHGWLHQVRLLENAHRAAGGVPAPAGPPDTQTWQVTRALAPSRRA
jgi:hypothetical protein